VGRITEVQNALRSCDRDRREHKATRKVRKRDLEDVRAEKAAYETYGDDMRQFKEIRSRWDEALRLEQEISRIQRLVEGSRRHTRFVKGFQGVEKVELPDADVLGRVEDLRAEIDRLHRLSTATSRVEGVAQRLAGVGEVELPAFEQELADRMNEITRLESLLAQARGSVRTVRAYKGVEQVELPELELGQRLAEVDTLERLVARLRAAATQGKEAKDALPMIDERVESLDAEIHELLHEAGICPTCEREVS